MSVNPLRPTMIAAAAVLALSCGGGGSPSSSTPATTLPSPKPTPTPIGGGGSVTASCAIGPGDPSANCSVDKKGGGLLAGDVMAAMDRLIQKKPQLFNLSDETAPVGFGNYKVVDHEGYLNGLVAELQGAGLCAQRNPDDYNYQQIQVKSENSFSENYDVLTAAGYVWHNTYSYRATCVPASFPVDRGDLPPAGSGCGAPYPPPIDHFNSKVWLFAPDFDTLDSTPIVVGQAYCAAVGFTDGRAACPVRVNGSPERIPCETWRVGYAIDTGRAGPTWTHNGHYCTGKASGCENDPNNQYALRVYDGGTYVMCGQNGACGSVNDGR